MRFRVDGWEGKESVNHDPGLREVGAKECPFGLRHGVRVDDLGRIPVPQNPEGGDLQVVRVDAQGTAQEVQGGHHRGLAEMVLDVSPIATTRPRRPHGLERRIMGDRRLAGQHPPPGSLGPSEGLFLRDDVRDGGEIAGTIGDSRGPGVEGNGLVGPKVKVLEGKGEDLHEQWVVYEDGRVGVGFQEEGLLESL